MNGKKKLIIMLLASAMTLAARAQLILHQPVPVVITNDFCGDADGLYALAHQLLCTSADVRGIVGTHLGGQTPWSAQGKMTATELSVKRAEEVVGLLGMQGKVRIAAGAESPLADAKVPIASEGARLIVEEARKCSPEQPLYVTVGASLTDVASAWLMDPSIADRIIVVWIGGQEYPFGHPFPEQFNKGDNLVEYNARLDIRSVQTVFNESNLILWQIPRDAYRQCLYGLAEIEDKIAPCGKLGRYLSDMLPRFGGDTYVLGDSPIVLISTLTTTFEPGAASCFYEIVKAPRVTDEGHYDFSHPGREIRVYKTIDTRLMLGDMESRFRLFARSHEQ